MENITALINRLKILGLSLVIGVLAGTISVAFHWFVSKGFVWVQSLFETLPLSIILIPTVAGLWFVFSQRVILEGDIEFGVGAVDRELKQIDLKLMSPKRVITKMFNTAVALVSGFSVGRFGPTVHLGGAIGSNIGYGFKLESVELRLLIGAGVAASISGVMHAPLFATIFVIEVLFSGLYLENSLPILLSSVVAYLFDRQIFGQYALIQVPIVPFESFTLIQWVLVLSTIGLVMGIVAGVFVLGLRFSSKHLHPIGKSNWGFAGVGFLTGLVMWVYPLIGQYMIDYKSLVVSGLAVGSLIALFVVRFVMTCIHLGSGVFGGSFVPGLSLGAIAGMIMQHGFDWAGIGYLSPGQVVVLSIVAMISGTAHAPLTAVIFLMELTGSMQLAVPMLIVAMVSYVVSKTISLKSAYGLL